MAFQTRNKHVRYSKSVYNPVDRVKKDGISDTDLWHLTHETVKTFIVLTQRNLQGVKAFCPWHFRHGFMAFQTR